MGWRREGRLGSPPRRERACEHPQGRCSVLRDSPGGHDLQRPDCVCGQPGRRDWPARIRPRTKVGEAAFAWPRLTRLQLGDDLPYRGDEPGPAVTQLQPTGLRRGGDFLYARESVALQQVAEPVAARQATGPGAYGRTRFCSDEPTCQARLALQTPRSIASNNRYGQDELHSVRPS